MVQEIKNNVTVYVTSDLADDSLEFRFVYDMDKDEFEMWVDRKWYGLSEMLIGEPAIQPIPAHRKSFKKFIHDCMELFEETDYFDAEIDEFMERTNKYPDA